MSALVQNYKPPLTALQGANKITKLRPEGDRHFQIQRLRSEKLTYIHSL